MVTKPARRFSSYQEVVRYIECEAAAFTGEGGTIKLAIEGPRVLERDLTLPSDVACVHCLENASGPEYYLLSMTRGPHSYVNPHLRPDTRSPAATLNPQGEGE